MLPKRTIGIGSSLPTVQNFSLQGSPNQAFQQYFVSLGTVDGELDIPSGIMTTPVKVQFAATNSGIQILIVTNAAFEGESRFDITIQIPTGRLILERFNGPLQLRIEVDPQTRIALEHTVSPLILWTFDAPVRHNPLRNRNIPLMRVGTVLRYSTESNGAALYAVA